MKRKFILGCIFALFIVGVNFIVMSPWLAQALGYYLLLVDAFFALCAVILVHWYKRT